jgi:hypothetical protein
MASGDDGKGCRLCDSAEGLKALPASLTLRLEAGDRLCSPCCVCLAEMMSHCGPMRRTADASTQTDTTQPPLDANQQFTKSLTPSEPKEVKQEDLGHLKKAENVNVAARIDQEKAKLLGAIKRGSIQRIEEGLIPNQVIINNIIDQSFIIMLS